MKRIIFLAALAAALHLFTSSALGAGTWTWPVRGKVITAYHNGSDPYAAGQHRGIDIAADVGDRVAAATSGTVTFAGVAGSSGLTVSIRTEDGRFDTSYLHLSSTAVRAGQGVAAGERIGAVGTTGRRSAEEPHLHFGVREAGQRQAYRDPMDFLAPPPAEPRPSPAPRPAPVPVADRAPIPLPAAVVMSPAATRVAAPAPAPRALTSRTPAVRAPTAPRSHSHAPSQHGASRPVRVPVAAPIHGAAAAAGARPDGVDVKRPAAARHVDSRQVELGAAPRTSPDSNEDTSHAPARDLAKRRAAERGGFDAGWLIACVGLVAAACALGRPHGARASAQRARAAFASLLRADAASGRQ